ncbi:MAG: 30S ribosome-binding factor RbfA [Anaerolineaceae bacterium]|jgi:ribosome-binding factor A
MPSQLRLHRIADRIREELSEMIIKEVKDPRVEMITITDVKVDRELAFADIFISAVEGSQRSQEVLEGLQSAAGFLRHNLAARIDLRVFPKLRFHWDPTPERADHIEQLLASIHKESDQKKPEASGSNEL